MFLKSNKFTAGKLNANSKLSKGKLSNLKKSNSLLKDGFISLSKEEIESSRSSAYSYIL